MNLLTALVVAGIVPMAHCSATLQAPLLHVRNEFEFTVKAPFGATFPLFGADGERAWAGAEWNPNFVYPRPAKDIQGAVFQIAHGHMNAVWVNTAMDPASGHIQYVYFLGEKLVTLIDIHITRRDAATTLVKVAYERTALGPEANEHVRQMGEHDATQGKEWEDAINKCLSNKPEAPTAK